MHCETTLLSPLDVKRATTAGNVADILRQQAVAGRLCQILWIMEIWPKVDCAAAFLAAAEHGHYALVEYFCGKGMKCKLLSEAMVLAAGEDHLNMVQLLRANGADPEMDNCAAIQSAATAARWHVVEYLCQEISSQNSDARIHNVPLAHYLDAKYADHYVKAAAAGDLDQVQILYAKIAINAGMHRRALNVAAEKGHWHIVKYLHSKDVKLSMRNKDHVALLAYIAENLDMIAYLWQHAWLPPKLYLKAVRSGKWHIVEILYATASDRHRIHTFDMAIQTKNLDLVQKLQSISPISITKCHIQSAVRTGDIDIVQYILQQYPASRNVLCAITTACQSGALVIFCYLYQTYPESRNQAHILNVSIQNLQFGILTFMIRECGRSIPQKKRQNIMELAAIHGNLELVQIVYQQDPSLREYFPAYLPNVVRYGHIEVLKYIYHLGIDLCVPTYDTIHTQVEAYLSTKIWLHKHVSELKQLAATIYLIHHAKLPSPESVPEDILRIMHAIQA